MTDVVTAVVNGVVAIALAWAGWGVWAMVVGHLTEHHGSTAMLWAWSPWWPRFRIRREDWAEIRDFSLNLTAANIAGFLLRNTDSFLVTRFLGADAMGFFSMGERLIRPTRVAAQTFMSVLNPALARAYDDDARLRRDLLRAAGGVCLVLHPLLVGLFLTADILVPVVLGPRWSGAVVVAQAMVFSAFAVRTVQVPHALFFAKSRTDLILRYTLLQGAALFVAGAIGVQFGLAAAVWALAGRLRPARVPRPHAVPGPHRHASLGAAARGPRLPAALSAHGPGRARRPRAARADARGAGPRARGGRRDRRRSCTPRRCGSCGRRRSRTSARWCPSAVPKRA